jgi:hypothetical protein
MAELPRMVKVLKGSTSLRAASQAFSLGVIGFTSGPVRKRPNQFVSGLGAQGTVCVFAADWPLAAGGSFPATGTAGQATFAAGQGAVAGAAGRTGLCDWGASGSGWLGFALCCA